MKTPENTLYLKNSHNLCNKQIPEMVFFQNPSNAQTLLCIAASIAASTALIRTLTTTEHILPFAVRCLLSSNLRKLRYCFSSQLTLIIEEYQDFNLFMAAENYLGNKFSFSVHRVEAKKNEKEIKPLISIASEEEICDVFEDAEIRWKLVYRENTRQVTYSLLRSYELSFNKNHKEKVLNSYIPYILQKQAKAMEENKKRKLHSLRCSQWRTSIPLNHPMTFDTIAMDSQLKQSLMDDLNRFRNSKELYRRIGKAWKRGYLLCGPPGSGKSSLIAAMANHLNCSIHDLDLTDYNNSYDIRALLHHYLDRTILVVRDVDSIFKIRDQYTRKPGFEVRKQDLLVKLLKHMDGLWMSRRTEMIIVATASGREEIDSALLSRMDMEIEMGYCTIDCVKDLVHKYFGRKMEVPEEIEEVLEGVKITIAEVSRELSKTTEPGIFFPAFLDFLCRREGKKKKKQASNYA